MKGLSINLVLENKAMITKNFRGMKKYDKSYFKRNELGRPNIKNRNRKGSKTGNGFNHS